VLNGDWFRRYSGYYGRSDLTQEELAVEVVSTIDDLLITRIRLNTLLGEEPGALPPTPPNGAAAKQWTLERYEAVRAFPIARAIEEVWRVAQRGAVEEAEIESAKRSCLEALKLFQPLAAHGSITISEIDNDSPLLYAWTVTCSLLWDKGLEKLLRDGRWFIAYLPSRSGL
jgi:hypothetical protein